MKDQQIQSIVAEVISRLAPRLGANGRRGSLIVPVSGATAGFGEAVRQIRFLILDGYQVRLAFSQAAEQLFGQIVREQLAGFPHISSIDPARWLSALGEARAIVCPLVSVNTISKLSLLIADNLVTNLILHGPFMGKEVIVARDGVDLTGQGRKALGIDNGTPVLKQALVNRLQKVTEYGCCITDVQRLRATVNSVLTSEGTSTPKQPEPKPHSALLKLSSPGRLITAADVRNTHRIGAGLSISSASLITPLARDLAMQLGVVFVESGGEGSH
jgi:hypothetical protein